MTLTNSQRSDIRRLALANGLRTGTWTDEQMISYGVEHGIIDAPQTASIAPTAPVDVPATPAPLDGKKAREPKSEPPTPPKKSKPAKSEAPSIDAAIRAIIEAQTVTAEIDEQRVIDLITEHAPKPQSEPIKVEYTAKDLSVKTSGHAHYILPELVKWLNLDEHIWLWGPASSGKTHIARQCAELLDLQFYSIGAILQKYEMTGYSDANGVFQTTEFAEWYQNGGLLYWDEADASIPQAFIAANGALENKFMAFPSLGTIEMHESCKLICTANTNGEGATQAYNGRAKLDRATVDRFHQISMGYDEALELKLGLNTFAQYGGTDEAAATNLIVWFQKVRKALEDKRLDVLISSRMQRRALKSMAVDPQTASETAQAIAFAKLTRDQSNDLIALCGAPVEA